MLPCFGRVSTKIINFLRCFFSLANPTEKCLPPPGPGFYLQRGTLFRCWQRGRTAATGRSAEERSVGKTLGVSETLRDDGSAFFWLGGSNNAYMILNVCGNFAGFHLNGVIRCICLGW